METATKFAAEDPYTLAGVIRNQTIHPWNLVYSNTPSSTGPATASWPLSSSPAKYARWIGRIAAIAS
jgi:hypothetical protein